MTAVHHRKKINIETKKHRTKTKIASAKIEDVQIKSPTETNPTIEEDPSKTITKEDPITAKHKGDLQKTTVTTPKKKEDHTTEEKKMKIEDIDQMTRKTEDHPIEGRMLMKKGVPSRRKKKRENLNQKKKKTNL